MHSPGTNSRTKGRLNISDAGPRFGSTKLAAGAPHIRAFCECVGVCAIRGALILAVVSALVLTAARPAQAQTETVLYNFCSQPNCSDGASPWSRLTFDGAGNLYGTTMFGGASGRGTVFELSPNGSGGWNESVLYSFCSAPNCTDGWGPSYSYVMLDSVGNLYGTTEAGGANGVGTVFELSPSGTSWNETVLYSFCSVGDYNCTDGTSPLSGLIMDQAGNLYGTTTYLGASGWGGNPFELSPSGGGWTYQVIYYQVNYDVGYVAALTMDAAGNLFGVNYDTVFELSPNGNGGWNPTVIHTFCSRPKDGCDAQGTLVLDKAGNLYGTTNLGGAENYGMVYKLSPGTKGWKEKILYSFNGAKHGSAPEAAGIVFDEAGNIYGTTLLGGTDGAGIVFELVAPVGTHKNYEEKVLWSFNGTDGSEPVSGLILDRAGNLYGMTQSGGSSGNGVVFEVNSSATATTNTLTSSPNPSTYGQAVTFTAVLSSSAGVPPDGETVTFEDGKTVLGTGSLSGGSASFTTSMLHVGTPTVKALYGGDFYFLGSTSNVVKQVVGK